MTSPTYPTIRIAIAVLAVICANAMAQSRYPPAPTSDASDVWHGKRYLDPYRLLEDLKDSKDAALGGKNIGKLYVRDAGGIPILVPQKALCRRHRLRPSGEPAR
jgi:hypothetical protein